MNRIIIALTLLALPVFAHGQQIRAVNEVIDCGQIIFKHPVTAEYEIKNTGHQDLLINKVMTDCGCTTVDYPRKPIAPQTSATIKVVYDSKLLGTFQKQIALLSNASTQPYLLRLRGKVVEEIVDFAGDYPFHLGELQTDVNNIEFDDVNRGDRPQIKIHIKNTTNEMAEPVLMHLPSYLQAEMSPSRLAPGHAGVATVTLDSRKIRDYGLTQTSIYLGFVPGDKVAPTKELTVSAVLLPDFKDAGEQARIAMPKMQLSATTLHLGNFGNKRKQSGRILIQNMGRATLEIERLQMFTGGIKVAMNKSRIEPGKVAKLKVTVVEEELKKVRSKPRILMITNDPDQPKVIIDIEVEK